MKPIAAVLLAAFPAAPCLAGEYQSLSTAEDGSALWISTRHGAIAAPRTLDDQQGFNDPQVSRDGTLVGWLALGGDCCQSYPLPRELVVFRAGKVIRTVTEQQAIFQWSFARLGTAVAYQQTFPHGLVPYFYKLRRISDGKLLEQFSCYPVEGEPNTDPVYENSGPVPAWVWAIAKEAGCPTP